jgi:signal transduction histidine kinase
MAASMAAMKSWNWEGRIRIESWNDTKWINLRASPKMLANHTIMWEGIMTNITESKLKEFEIRHSRTRLAELQNHMLKVKEQERTRIAREIHDDLGGDLTAIKMALARLVRFIPENDQPLIEKSDYLNSLVDRAIESAHRIAHDLRPGILDCGIVATLEWQSKEFERQSGIPCKFSVNQEEINLHTDQATAIFRMFQEALTNIAKHAHASKVEVRLVRSKHHVRLRIKDDGRGIVSGDRHKKNSFGIRGMVERAKALGGALTINPGREGGSVVTIRIPTDSD